MTGEEFLNKVREIKKITDIRWQIEGDYFEPNKVKLVVIADGEKIEVTYPKPKSEKEFFQNVCIALIINKFMQQIGYDSIASAHDDIAKAVNHAIKQIQSDEMRGKDA